jgi:hypothetical protein
MNTPSLNKKEMEQLQNAVAINAYKEHRWLKIESTYVLSCIATFVVCCVALFGALFFVEHVRSELLFFHATETFTCFSILHIHNNKKC